MSKSRLYVLNFFLFSLLVAPLTNIYPQNPGTVKGRITDNEGNPVPFANVIVMGTTLGGASDAQGNYSISNVPAGSHEVKVSAIGYKSVSSSASVQSGMTNFLDFELESDILNMGEVVVTGTISPIPKLESTVAISTLTPMQLEQANPRSTTEVLRYVPGFTRVESSGGEVNQNISMRGILGVEYVMFMEDGLPVFPTMHTFFMNADNLFRADENIRTVEVVRGGSSALFGSNTPGAIINFINKTGGSTFGGIVKATGATEGLARFDFNFNGPISEDLRFSIGGFYRYDQGVRNPGFPGIRGGQFKANLMKLLDNGYIKASIKFIDDRNQFILPLPFQNPTDPEYVPGFSEYGALNTAEANNLLVPTPTGDLQFPLEDGLRTQAYWLTADVSFDFENDWTLRNSAQFMNNNQGWNGIFPGSPVNATEWLNSQGFPSTAQLYYINNFDDAGNRVPVPFDMGSNDGLAFVSPSQLVTVQKPISAFQDQVQILKTFDKKHTLSLGLYFANYTQTNRWFFSDILMDVRDNPKLLDVIDFSGDTTEYTMNGFRRFVSLYRNGTGSTTIFSTMLGGSFQITDDLRADLGARWELNDFFQDAENSADVDLDGDPQTTYDNEAWGNRVFRHFSKSLDDYAISGGLNYTITDEFAVYAQGSRAFKMPALDEFLDAQAQGRVDLFENRKLSMVEGGVKYSSQDYAFTVNGFWGELTNIVGQGFVVRNGVGQWEVVTSPDNRTWGVELEASATPSSGFNILGVGTYTKPEVLRSGGAALTAGGIPDFIGNLVASYNFQGFQIYGDFHYVGSRALVENDGAQVGELPAYNYMNAGVSYTFPGQAIKLSADILNIYQSIGLEEGNPRTTGTQSFYYLARPLLPRRVMASLTYQF